MSKVKKSVPASVIVKNVQYKKEDTTLKLKSISPEKIINSSEVWVFNTKVRRLFRYVALSGNKLSIKGTTLTGVDPEKSGGKILRKPEEQLNNVDVMTSRPLSKMFNDIRATVSAATGRLNEDTIILKAF